MTSPTPSEATPPPFLATVEVKMPPPWNYLSFKNVEGSIDVALLPDEQLRAIGAAWIESLVANAAKRRKP